MMSTIEKFKLPVTLSYTLTDTELKKTTLIAAFGAM
jgi:hypothetical protein